LRMNFCSDASGKGNSDLQKDPVGMAGFCFEKGVFEELCQEFLFLWVQYIRR